MCDDCDDELMMMLIELVSAKVVKMFEHCQIKASGDGAEQNQIHRLRDQTTSPNPCTAK